MFLIYYSILMANNIVTTVNLGYFDIELVHTSNYVRVVYFSEATLS